MHYQASLNFSIILLRHSYACMHAKHLNAFLANIIGSTIEIMCASFIALTKVTNWNQDMSHVIELGFVLFYHLCLHSLTNLMKY